MSIGANNIPKTLIEFIIKNHVSPEHICSRYSINILKERGCVALYAKCNDISWCVLYSPLFLSVFSSFEVASSASASGMWWPECRVLKKEAIFQRVSKCYQLSWKCKLATVKSLKADVSSVSPLSERLDPCVSFT